MFESPYRLSSTAKAFGGGKYCFTLNVVPTPGCTSHCCTKADVKNMEFDVRKECKARGMAVKVTVNGAPTVMGANFDLSDHGPLGRTILRLTQLGLGLDSNGTEVCITLVTNNADNGCTTLEELCMPPPGQPAGICSAVLFNTQLDCCPISNVNTPNPMAPVVLALPLPSPPLQSLPSPSVLPLLPAPPPPRLSFSFSIASRPPSPPSPPSSPLPSPPLPSAPPSYSSPPFLSPPFPLLASASNPLPTPTPCTFCTYLTITPRNPLYPINITKSQCYIFVEIVVADIVARAQMEDAILRSDSPAISCANNQVKICGLFASDAEGAKLQPWIEARVTGWLSIVTDLATCPAFLNGYDVAVATGGDGQWPNLPASCLNATRTVACRPQEIPFPKFA
ncbi:hypothetical protein Vretimale_5766 [Volvox reticuliferus]|uniref:Pherophorin domain-containing protein n=1 Tax=Volvox reticuliferus TaxID=1737510 RepID=A0A8J4G667_9CHLO|nr:hypothetical protein Vretimale_5766 [Volvox reticuliferus]